jgi:WD40 repeat protein
MIKRYWIFLFLILSCTTPHLSKNPNFYKLPKIPKLNLTIEDIQKIKFELGLINTYSYEMDSKIELPGTYKIYESFFTKNNDAFLVVSSFRISLYSFPELKEIEFLEPRKIVEGGFTGISLSKDNKEILAGSSWENKVLLLNWKGKIIRHFSCKYPYTYAEDVSFINDDSQVAITCSQFAKDKKYLGLYTKDGKEISFRETKHSYINHFSKTLITYSDKEYSTTNLTTNINKVGSLPKFTQLVFFHSEKDFITYSNNHWYLWQTNEKDAKIRNNFLVEGIEFFNKEIPLDTDFKSFAALSPDHQYLLTGGMKGGYLWTRNGILKMNLDGHKTNVSSVGFDSDGTHLFTASKDSILFWKKIVIN